MVKFNIGTWITIDTDDKYHPIVLSDRLVDLFFFATAGLHLWQANRYRFDSMWMGIHAALAGISAYWPYMIHQEYTHKGLGHASYGLLALVPHLSSLQAFGALMLGDKIINLDDLTWPNGVRLLPRTDPNKPLNSYGIDNLFLDNWLMPKSLTGLSVNVPFMALSSFLEYRGGTNDTLSAITWFSAAVTAVEDWLMGYNPNNNNNKTTDTSATTTK